MRRLSVVLACAVLALSCAESTVAPTASLANAAPKPGQPNQMRAIGGFTLDEDGRPMGGVNVSAWVQSDRSGYSYWWANGPQSSDFVGHYRLSNLPDGTRVTLQVWKDGYVQQCAAPTRTMTEDVELNVTLVSRARVSAAAASVPQPAAGYRNVSGVVFEDTPQGRQPLAGAFVDFEPVMDFPGAVTYSDSEGRYLLCGIPEATSEVLGASAGTNRHAYVTVPPRQTIADIEIPRSR